MLVEATKPKRCAVYTRKSSEEGLEQQFNSLHAQREACEAYIASQKHEGWELVADEYDDGGFSGGSMQRPGLQKLLADIAAGTVNVVVTYKVDRLTRSLSDFAKIVDVLDAAGASFVSVTQAFNTTTSMGRLTLNVLLSFAQFEREVTGERIRDKLAASKAKGMWMGGLPPLGYDAVDKALVVNAGEAADVRRLFELYRELKSADAVVAQAYDLGIRSKLRTNKAGIASGGGRILRGALYSLLANSIYVGEIPHKEKRYAGLHEPIVSRDLFDAVQALIEKNRRKHVNRPKAEHPALLSGMVFDEKGRRLISTHTSKGTRRYRYYAAAPDGGEPMRVPAKDLEQLVVDAVISRLQSSEAVAADAITLGAAQNLTKVLGRATALAGVLGKLSGSRLRAKLSDIIVGVTVGEASIETRLRADALIEGAAGVISVLTPSAITRRKNNLALVLPGKPQLAPDAALITCVAQGRTWFGELASGKVKSMQAIAERDGVTRSYVGRLLDLAFLAPDLVTMIMEGRQPPDLTAARLQSLCPLPMDFGEQRALLAA